MAALTLRVSASVYPRESLEAAGRALRPRAQARVAKAGTAFRVTLSPRRGKGAELAGELMNEALSHLYRQRVIRLNRPLSQALMGRLCAKSFLNVPRDPLEEMEPQVAEDRKAELAELLAKARAMSPAAAPKASEAALPRRKARSAAPQGGRKR